MYSEILKENYEMEGDVAVFADGVRYNANEMKHLSKITCDVELMRLTHVAKRILGGEVVHAV